MNWKAKWLKPAKDMGDVAPRFKKEFSLSKTVKEAKLYVTALGVYEVTINDKRVSDYVLAPGWTTYMKRLQYQEYDVTDLLTADNEIHIWVGKGWYRSPMESWSHSQSDLCANPAAMLSQLEITYTDGSEDVIVSDTSWTVSESCIRFSEIYDGEICDGTHVPDFTGEVEVFDGPFHTLLPQQGEEIKEQERLAAARLFVTPKGETVIDFGQEVTGYLEVTVDACAGDIVDVSFAEVMDKEGNFYNDNYRKAKAQYHYTCHDGKQTYKPKFTFYGFRYIRINSFPGGVSNASLDHFTAVVVHSELKRTGYLSCSDPLLNRLFDNIIWGQKGNFLDVPTDCPQRDERLGWTGDAQVFVRTACLNYDVEKFFTKWLSDMAADQHPDGYVGHIIPDLHNAPNASAAWGDAATVCPWEIYLAYGNPAILEAQFECMHKWVDYITSVTKDKGLWTGSEHYGDWLGLDAPVGSYKGSSREEFIASAFYAHSASLVIKAGKVLGKDVSAYEALYDTIVKTFRQTYTVYNTQTECVLAAHFKLAPDPQAAADQLAQMIKDNGIRLQTGFVGTPYLLHVLSSYGYTDLAYSLLLRKEYPSWLYPVTKGATTIWEHWDGIMEDGNFWDVNMNSFNHYAYGSVADWVYGVAAGITPVESAPGYAKVRIAPTPDVRLDWLKAVLDTRHGQIRSEWKKLDTLWRYEITTPVEAVIVIAGREHRVTAGTYYFYSDIDK